MQQDEKCIEVHNQLVTTLVKTIVKPMLMVGGTQTDVLILLESVIAGVIWTLDGDPEEQQTMIDVVMENLPKRIEEIENKRQI